MKQTNLPLRQRGVALIVSLLLLFVMILLGVASFSNTHVQERSANNIRLQSMAFEAASAGASNAIAFFLDRDDHTWSGGNAPADELCGSLQHEGWEQPTGWVNMGTVGDATLEQRLYCIGDAYPCDDDEAVDCGVRPPRSQLFVHSRGSVQVDGETVSVRDVEVRLDIGQNWIEGQGCGALCFPSCNHLEPGRDGLDFPSSNVFQVDGDGGPAITTRCSDFTDDVVDAIGSNRLANYSPPGQGISTADPGAPWNTPEETIEFQDNLRLLAQAAQDSGQCETACYHDGFYEDNGNTVYGTRDDPQILFIDGDAEFGGGVSGAGILFVTGTLSWNGTPNWHGLMVTVGGNFSIDGGGHGGNPGSKETVVSGGTVVMLNLDTSEGVDEFGFGPVGFQNTGGGNALYRYDCEMLLKARELLLVPFAQTNDAASQWDINCERGPQTFFELGPQELVIASWRENIGWREEHFE